MAKASSKPSEGFDDEDELGGIYRWLVLQCSDKALGDLITKIHDTFPHSKKEITKTGSIEHKSRMLRRAVALGFLKKDELESVLRGCEESGQQWIFLFRPKSADLAVVSNSAKIADKLFGGLVKDFPRFEWPEEELLWADFKEEIGNSKKDWQVKIYAHSNRRNKVDFGNGEKVAGNNNRFRDWVDYEYDPAYLVHVVRWRNSMGLLEVRIDKEGSLGRKSEKQTRLNSVVDLLLPAFNVAGMNAWKLENTCMNLLSNRNQDDVGYRIGHVRILDKTFGKSNIAPVKTSVDIDADSGRKIALDGFIKNGAKPTEASIMLAIPKGMEKPNKVKVEVDEEDGNDDELRTVIGGDLWNEISISRRITPELLDYVIASFCRTNA